LSIVQLELLQCLHMAAAQWLHQSTRSPLSASKVPNWAFNMDANSGHAFGILLAAVGALHPCGAPAPVN